MSDSDFNPNLIHQPLQVFLKNIMPAGVASTAIGQSQNAGSQRVIVFAVVFPPVFNAVAAKLAGILAGS